MEKQKDNEYQMAYFPFTHGDNIERQREFMRGELKEELKAK